MNGGATKFTFSDLPKVSRAELTLAEAFSFDSLNTDSINATLRHALDQLEPITPEKLDLRFQSCLLESRAKALATFGKDSVCVFGNISKESVPFALELNERAVIELVYLLLGSETEAPSKKTTLSAVEEGIFSFILSLVFGSLQNYL